MSVKRRAKAKHRERDSRIRRTGNLRTPLYDGIVFASMLEVAWASFFTELGIRWHYEPELIRIDRFARYPPDFYLPEFECYVECKGRQLYETDRKRIRQAVEVTDKPFLLLRGSPYKAIFRPDNTLGMELYMPRSDSNRPHTVRVGRSEEGTIAFYRPGTMKAWVANGPIDPSFPPKFVTDGKIRHAALTKLDDQFYTPSAD